MSLRDQGLEYQDARRPAARWARLDSGRLRQRSVLWGGVLFVLLLAIARAATADGGLKSRPLESGLYGIALALLGMVWTARADGLKALGASGGNEQSVRRLSRSGSMAAATALLIGFALLALAVRL